MLNVASRPEDLAPSPTTTTTENATTTCATNSAISSAGMPNTAPHNLSSPTTTTTTKEKRSWFHSLTRRKKTQSHTSFGSAATTPTATEQDDTHLQNNNNEPLLHAGPTRTTSDSANSTSASTSQKRKDEKNVFQRLRKKMGLRFHSLRRRRHGSDDDNDGEGANGTTDASGEFLTKSPIMERQMQLKFSFSRGAALEEPEMTPFTYDYRRFIVKKWSEPNQDMYQNVPVNSVMFKACSEMLGQVWYWGEISRRDAQKHLTDKPTGTFLVRDSETLGCHFTLSFRIMNVTLHYRLEYRDNYWHFEELQYESIVEMIEDVLYRSTNNFLCFVKMPNETQPSLPVMLKYPLSRYYKMPQLQDLCRRVIQRHTTPAEIAKLPIPHKLLEYLNEKRELVFQT